MPVKHHLRLLLNDAVSTSEFYSVQYDYLRWNGDDWGASVAISR